MAESVIMQIAEIKRGKSRKFESLHEYLTLY